LPAGDPVFFYGATIRRCDDSPVRRFAGAIRFSSAIRFFDVSFRSIKNSWLFATSDPQTVPLKVKLLLVDQN
jgi:hypothetical protein